MFTGLIAEQGQIISLRQEGGVTRVTFQAAAVIASGFKLGDSMAVNGICLTAVELSPSTFTALAIAETVGRTTLSEWRAGDTVNLERSLALGDRLDGHLVAGHVDGVAVVQAIQREGSARRIRFSAPEELLRFIAEKGSVTLDGVSLTVAGVLGQNEFSVALIPYTLSSTNLEQLAVGKKVNLEVDLIARYLDRLRTFQTASAQGLTIEHLRMSGF